MNYAQSTAKGHKKNFFVAFLLIIIHAHKYYPL